MPVLDISTFPLSSSVIFQKVLMWRRNVAFLPVAKTVRVDQLVFALQFSDKTNCPPHPPRFAGVVD